MDPDQGFTQRIHQAKVDLDAPNHHESWTMPLQEIVLGGTGVLDPIGHHPRHNILSFFSPSITGSLQDTILWGGTGDAKSRLKGKPEWSGESMER